MIVVSIFLELWIWYSEVVPFALYLLSLLCQLFFTSYLSYIQIQI